MIPELAPGTRLDLASLLPSPQATPLTVRVAGAGPGPLPRGLRVWAVRASTQVAPGTLLTWGPDGPGLGETHGEVGVPGVSLDLAQLLTPGPGDELRLGASWPAREAPGPGTSTPAPLALEICSGGHVLARASLLAPLHQEGAGAWLLARVYHSASSTLRLHVQAERLRDLPELARLLGISQELLAPRPATPASPAGPPPSVPPGGVIPASVRSLRRAWRALLAVAALADVPATGEAVALPAPGPAAAGSLAPPSPAPPSLRAQLAHLRAAVQAEERAQPPGLLDPEGARRRARLSSLDSALALIEAEEAASVRRERALLAAGTSPEEARAALAEVRAELTRAEAALRRAVAHEARELAQAPLSESVRRLQAEASFLEDSVPGLRGTGPLDS